MVPVEKRARSMSDQQTLEGFTELSELVEPDILVPVQAFRVIYKP